MLAGLMDIDAALAARSGFASYDGATDNATLSNGNLTVTRTGAGLAGARSTSLKNSGKFYFEVTLTTINGNNSCVGILTSAGTYTNLITNGTNNAEVFLNAGSIFSNDASSGRSLGGLASGDIIGVAVDFTNQKVWFRKAPAGNWNGQVIASQDPENNVGGVSISNYSATTMSPAMGLAGVGAETFTANFGASAFTGAVPSGFTAGWTR